MSRRALVKAIKQETTKVEMQETESLEAEIKAAKQLLAKRQSDQREEVKYDIDRFELME